MQVLCFFDPAILHPQHPVCLRCKPLVVGDIHHGLVLLCGCGGEKSLTVQDQYRTVVSADMEAEVVSRTASDDRTFTLTCRYDRAGQSVTTVTAPEALKGLTAVLADGQLSLKSRDQLLPAGDATDICPANCLPELLRTLAEGYLKEQGTEPLEDTPCLRLTLETTGQSGAAVLCSVWLDESSLIPRYAEFSQNGNVVLTVRMISFACTTGDTEA